MVEMITVISTGFAVVSTLVSGGVGIFAYISRNRQKIRSMTHQNIEDKIIEVIEDQNEILDRVKRLEKDNNKYFRKKLRDMEMLEFFNLKS